MSIDIDPEKAARSINARERLCIKLVILLIGMLYPAKYDNQLEKFMSGIREEIAK